MTNKKSKPSRFIDLNKKNIYNIILTIQIKDMNQIKFSILFFLHTFMAKTSSTKIKLKKKSRKQTQLILTNKHPSYNFYKQHGSLRTLLSL